MDEPMTMAVAILGVICLGLVVAAITRNTVPDDPERGTDQLPSPAPPSITDETEDPLHPKHDHPWAFALLGIALIALAVLGFLVVDLRRDLAAASSSIEDAVQAGEDAIEVALAQALAAVPDTAELERADADLERINRQQQTQLDAHSRMLQAQADLLSGLTGFGSSSIDASDIDVPLFCNGELAIWSSGFGRGLTC